jgi:hypothetical protein
MNRAEHTYEGLVAIAVAPNEVIAELWRGLLKSEGITAMVKATGPGLAYFTNFANEHVLYVLQSDAEVAHSILAEEVDEDEGGEPVR